MAVFVTQGVSPSRDDEETPACSWKGSAPMLQFLTQFGRKTTCLLLCGLCLTNWVSAQEIQRTTAEAGRPAPLNTQVGLSPEMLKTLQTWEQESGKVTKIRGEFKRIEYDKIMATATCAKGTYFYESPDKGRMDFLPDETVAGKKAKKRDLEFTCQADQTKTWICNGKEILAIDLTKKEYDRLEIPAEFQGRNISEGPLPFLFGMSAAKMEQRYVLAFGAMHDPNKTIHIVAYPKHPQEQREYRVAEVLLDPKTYYPMAVQLLDTTGNKETVYLFSKHDKVTVWLPTAPWNPLLIGYKEITNQRADAPSLDRETREASRNQGVMLR
jgi:TIGR03009 family protein